MRLRDEIATRQVIRCMYLRAQRAMAGAMLTRLVTASTYSMIQERSPMLEKVSQLAEQAATNVSRRQFLGRFGRGALAVAMATGGLLAVPSIGHAGRRQPRLCLAGSISGCAGQLEGSECYVDTFGRCQGPKPRGDKSTTTICGCA